LRQLDRYHVAGAGLTIKAIRNRVDVKLGYNLVDERGTYNYVYLASANATKISPIKTDSETHDLSFKADVKLTNSASVSLGYLFERYQVSDWQRELTQIVSGELASENNIMLATYPQDYNAHVGSVVFKYRWGK
jgi:hypothetical protein